MRIDLDYLRELEDACTCGGDLIDCCRACELRAEAEEADRDDKYYSYILGDDNF